jgi:hypothetical protein
LMFRLANERRKAIDERSAEGQRIRRLLRYHFAAPIIVDVYPPRDCRRLCRHLFTGAGFHSARDHGWCLLTPHLRCPGESA